jgi:hypothetical protein
MNWLAIINLVFVYLSWKWASEAFDNGNNVFGWFQIFASALNAAALASVIF